MESVRQLGNRQNNKVKVCQFQVYEQIGHPVHWVCNLYAYLSNRERLPGREVARKRTPGPPRQPGEEAFAFSRKTDERKQDINPIRPVG